MRPLASARTSVLLPDGQRFAPRKTAVDVAGLKIALAPPSPTLPESTEAEVAARSSAAAVQLAAMAPEHAELAASAAKVLIGNDMGFAVKPSPKLYPHQWNWDSGFIAMGLATFEPQRAQRELLQLLAAQWKDGMVPHIVFNPAASSYFPGPELWQVERSKNAPLDPRGQVVATSGHSQPPVLATAARSVFERSAEGPERLKFLRQAYPKLLAFQRFWYQQRDPAGSGLSTTTHPWETGRDNAPEWLALMKGIEPTWTPVYQRKDDKLVDPSERPTKAEYDRFIYLVEMFRELGYDNAKITEQSPFLAQDVLMNALLQRSNEDLAWIARTLVEHAPSRSARRRLQQDLTEIEGYHAKTKAAFGPRFWDPQRRIFRGYDLRADRPIDIASVATFAPLYAGLATEEQARSLVEHLRDPEQFGGGLGVPSTSKAEHAYYDPKKYWLGPSWINTNWLVIRGLERYGYHDLALELRDQTLSLLQKNGFSEYFDTATGEGRGGGDFSWSAALLLDLLADPPAARSTGRDGAGRR